MKNSKTVEVTVNHATKLIGRTTFTMAFGVCILVSSFFLASCGSQPGSGQHATIQMRDGSTLSGTVTSTSASEITLTADDTTKHTIPMVQVKSIEYDDAPAAQTSAGQSSSAASSSSGTSAGGGSSASSGTGAPKRRSSASRAKADAMHEEHYHPTQDEIQTKTYVLAAGTKVSVRTEEMIDSAKAVEGQTFAAEMADDVID